MAQQPTHTGAEVIPFRPASEAGAFHSSPLIIPQDAAADEREHQPSADWQSAYELFQLQVRLDMESERELLYRVALMVEAIVVLVLLRELMLRIWF